MSDEVVPAPTGVTVYPDARDAIFGALFDAAAADRNIVVLTADTGALKFRDFIKHIPDQLINVGVSEQNAVSVAAGLATTGRHVFVYGISSFVTLRALEQIKVDVCTMGLPVTILGLGTGYVYSTDGPTHHILEDIAVMRTLPGLGIWSPSDYVSAARSIDLALDHGAPGYIRFDKGPFDPLYPEDHEFGPGLARLRAGAQGTIIATGIMTTQAMRVAKRLELQGMDVGVIDVFRLKPLNGSSVLELLGETPRIFTLEEHFLEGGLGSIIAETVGMLGNMPPVVRLGVSGSYRAEVGDREFMRSLDGIDQDSLVKYFAGAIKP
ncbi:MAG: 1-deoxy-D-xylulose-5-phosphate synthase [Rhodospirillales bacterium]|nr:1-deoxy-D-xylulose-5-phosphate synthase [Rhodospirillales bacterium]